MINRDILKLIAILSMTLDHIGYLLFPQNILLRAIGRLAFPIFAYFIAEGFTYTHDSKAYFLRLLVSAIITQVLFYMVGLDFVNVLFTFAISVAVLMVNQYDSNLNIVALLLGMAIAIAIQCDYSFYGVLAVWVFYFEKDFGRLFGKLFLLTTLLLLSQINFDMRILYLIFANLKLNIAFFLQYLCLFSLPLLMLYNHKKGEYTEPWLRSVMKYGFYCYYPIHLVILKLIGG